MHVTPVFLLLATAAQAAPASQPADGAATPVASRTINPTRRTLRFVVPVADNGIYLGDINMAVAPGDSISVDSQRLFEMLKSRVKADVLARLKAAAANRAEVSAEQLSAEQIGLSYDSDNLALAIQIPAAARVTEILNLRSSESFGAQTLEPAPFSAFVNVRWSLDVVEKGADPGIRAPVSLIDGAMRAFGVVAEGEGYLSLRKGERFFRRTGSRLVYDDMTHLIRFAAGDTQILPRAFQGTPIVAGLSASRLLSVLEPARDFRSSGSQSFTLLAPSTVETIVNGQSVEHRVLPPGSYTIHDFPLAEGANDVRLVIDDPTGKRRTIDFSLYSDLQLLNPGATEFSTFAGVYSEPGVGGISYSSDWAASGFVRRGISQQFTGGVNAQADARAQQVGIEGVFGGPVGLIGVELAASRAQTGAEGFAAALTFEKLIQAADSARGQSLRAAIEYRSRRFATPGNPAEEEPLELQASAGYALTFGVDAYVSIDGQYARDRLQDQERYSARLGAGFRLANALALVCEAQLDRRGPDDRSLIRIGIRKRFGGGSTAQANIDSRGVARGSIQAQGGSGVGAWSASGDFNRDSRILAANGTASYAANRAELGLAQFAGYDTNASHISDIRTSLRAATSISFADGVFAVGRPIHDAFLVADAHRSLKGANVVLDPQGESEEAQSGAFGAAVDGTLTAYAPRTLIYNVPDAPSGYDLGAGNIQIRPPYKSGYHLRVGSDYHLLVIGRLLGRDGKPIALLAGTAHDLADPKHPAITMFTSRGGKFGAQGLRPGKWRIEMPTPGRATIFEFNVTDDPTGTVRVGDIEPVR